MFWIFSEVIVKSIEKLDVRFLYEIRVRNNMPIRILYQNKWGYLSKNGFTVSALCAIVAPNDEAINIAVKASENSLYSVCDDIAKGYLTLSDGIRIGLCGESVNVMGKTKTFKNFTSAIVRIPHQIDGASQGLLKYVYNKNTIFNSIIVSSAGGGKTTLLRDMAKNLSTHQNVVIVDERYEIAGVNNGFSFDVGQSDVISGCGKSIAIENAIRSCAPDVIITDEISAGDFEAIRQAVSSGVKIITSIHSNSIENLLKKPNFEKFLSDKIFEIFIVLQGRENPGKCVGVYDDNLNLIVD